MKESNTSTIATPTLDSLLDELGARLKRGIWLHGLGSLALALSAWVLFAFLADWVLRVPGPVRVFHTLGFCALAAFVLRRELIVPLRRLPDRAGLALLIERYHPELQELFVSAVQLRARGPLETEDKAKTSRLVESVVAEAEARARTINPSDALDPKGPRRRTGLGLGALATLLLLGLLFPLHAQTFLRRALGSGPNWPQRTHLAVEIPDLGEGTEVERGQRLVRVRVARGTDVPVVVRAEGITPDEVVLHFDGGRDLALNPTGAGLFRTLLRSLQEDARFFVTGGDDTDGLPVVEVEVLQPPDIEGIAIAVTPPAYTDLPQDLTFNRDVEVLAGSKIVVAALQTPSDARGVARLLPQDSTVELAEVPFPADPAGGDDPAVSRRGLGFDFWADRSVAFRIELTDPKGLSNPDPGLFRVQVIEDRAPEVQVLEPTRGEIEVVLGGTLPLRARIADDFGLMGASWLVMDGNASAIGRDAKNDGEAAGQSHEGAFTLLPLASEEQDPDRRAKEVSLASVRLEVSSLAGADGQVSADQRFEILILARDNRAPEANQGRSFPIRVRVVTPEELLRRMQDRLGQARLSALRLSELQGEKRARTEELFAALDEPGSELDTRAIANAIAGQRRVIGDARALAQELASIAADVLYARIEEKADGLLEIFDASVSRSADPRFRPEPWLDLGQAIDEGRVGDAGFATKLVSLVNLALVISEDSAPSATQRLAQAEKATEVELGATELAAALEQQDLTLERIDALVDELAQWNNFQDVLQLTRDILNRQRTLRERTEKFAKRRDK